MDAAPIDGMLRCVRPDYARPPRARPGGGETPRLRLEEINAFATDVGAGSGGAVRQYELFTVVHRRITAPHPRGAPRADARPSRCLSTGRRCGRGGRLDK